MRLLITTLLIATGLIAQTKVDLGNQGKNINFGGITHTTPTAVVTSLPATCSVGELTFDSAVTAGQNLYGCTATNTWTLISGSGGVTSVGATFPALFSCTGSPVTTSGTIVCVYAGGTPSLVAGSNITITGGWPNQTITAAATNLPWTTLGDTVYYTGTAPARLAGPTTTGTYVLTESPAGTAVAPVWTAAQQIPSCSSLASGTVSSPSCITASGGIGSFIYVDAQTGTSYNVPASDVFGLVTSNNSSAVAWALPQAALGSNYPNGSSLWVRNLGAGTVTITPSSPSTINGGTTYTVAQGHSAQIVVVGGNYVIGVAY